MPDNRLPPAAAEIPLILVLMTLNDENLEMTKQATEQETSPEIRAVNAKIYSFKFR
jgi:hypothetical protein